MRTAWIVLITLSASYVALALYGKYRTIKADYRQAVEDEARRRDGGVPPA